MTPRFRHADTSVQAAVRRIACAQIDAGLAAVTDPGMSPARKVHRLRQQCKALRALVRLVRPAFDGFVPADREFRDISRSLSGTRDAAVLIGTVERLAADGAPAPARFDLAAIRAALHATLDSDAAVAERLRACEHRLVEAHGHAARWELAAEGWEAIGPGLERTDREAREAMRQTAAGGDAQASHDWRKQVKYHAGHVRLLVSLRPHLLRARHRLLDKVGDLLGEAHDMEILLDALAANPRRFGGIVSVTTLAALARRRKARLDHKALRLGEALFAEKPRVLAARWGGWWRDWKGGRA
jgi:hypothetical protein